MNGNRSRTVVVWSGRWLGNRSDSFGRKSKMFGQRDGAFECAVGGVEVALVDGGFFLRSIFACALVKPPVGLKYAS